MYRFYYIKSKNIYLQMYKISKNFMFIEIQFIVEFYVCAENVINPFNITFMYKAFILCNFI